MKILFFGSTSDSVIVLDRLLKPFDSPGPTRQLADETRVVAIVTQPPRPVGRRQTITTTPVQARAEKLGIQVYSFGSDQDKPWLYADEVDVAHQLTALDYDLVVSASYGQKIPITVIKKAKYGGLNVHPSLLPRWRGADPVPWAILAGDTRVGVTVVTLEEQFDSGKIIAQEEYTLPADAIPDPVRTHLFTRGAELLVQSIQIQGLTLQGQVQDMEKASYAGRMNRQTGFVPWELVEAALAGSSPSAMEQWNNITIAKTVMDRLAIGKDTLATVIERAVRALSPWPGVWSEIDGGRWKVKGGKKRIKLLKAHLSTETDNQPSTTNPPARFAGVSARRAGEAGHQPPIISPTLVLDLVQLEGKEPVSFTQFQKAYLQ